MLLGITVFLLLGIEAKCAQKYIACPGSEIVVKSRSVKRNAKNARGLGRVLFSLCPF